jgi:nitrite reductase/ring-hydroxylating ferredoxin subunit
MRIEDSEQISIPPDGGAPEAQPKWRQSFPIDWPKDEYRSRRDFTKLLGLTSFAFVVGQAWIMMLSWMGRERPAGSSVEIAEAAALPVGAAKLFHYPTAIDPCILVRLAPEKFVAFAQKCTHLSCPVIPRPAEGRFYCPCHSGSFDIETGYPLAGPPRRPLPRILLEVRDGKVFATGVAKTEVV